MKSKREQKTETPQRRAPTSPKISPPATTGKWKARGILFAIALAAYSNSFGLGLVQDSFAIVTQDTRIQQVSGENIRLIFEKDYWWPKHADWLYRPLTTASLLVNYSVLGSGA